MKSHGLTHPGDTAIAAKGWLGAHKWLLARRLSQALVVAVFLTGPLFGLWIAKGNLASSLTLGVLPLTDPLMVLQGLLAGHVMTGSALIGAALVLVAYTLFGGRTYCSWVCPVNAVTDFAQWLRTRFGMEKGVVLNRNTRLWVLGGILVGSAATGTIAWELVNPVTMLHRGLVTGSIVTLGSASLITLAVFCFDLGIASRGWCTHLCPVGAFYGLLGRAAVLRVSAVNRSACDDCMDCFAICPERHVIAPALRGAAKGVGPLILSSDCTNCGRCIDVCSKTVFRFDTRFHNASLDKPSAESGVKAA
ncbi:MAG: quinol dehydrogenase ferredoxin subunit NapH [Magnetospirillum sp.]|nr:quinol dehydrogenase ferredoxin subunit NapH [Magnetospirillum sp.]